MVSTAKTQVESKVSTSVEERKAKWRAVIECLGGGNLVTWRQLVSIARV